MRAYIFRRKVNAQHTHAWKVAEILTRNLRERLELTSVEELDRLCYTFGPWVIRMNPYALGYVVEGRGIYANC